MYEDIACSILGPRAHPRRARAGSANGAPDPGRQRPQMLDQLWRLAHLEVDAEHRDAHCQPSEIVVARPVTAGARVDRLDRAPVGGDAARDLLRGRVQGDQRLEAVWRPRDALLDVRG